MTSLLTNSSALMALQAMRMTNQQMEDTQQAISTGMRVATAKQNAAYWSIATTMRSDNMALSAVQDALGLSRSILDTMYAAMENSIEEMKSIKEKLVAASADGTSKRLIQADITQRQKALENYADTAVFNEANWLSRTAEGSEGYNQELIAAFKRDGGKLSISTIDVNIRDILLFDGPDGGILGGRALATGAFPPVENTDSNAAGIGNKTYEYAQNVRAFARVAYADATGTVDYVRAAADLNDILRLSGDNALTAADLEGTSTVDTFRTTDAATGAVVDFAGGGGLKARIDAAANAVTSTANAADVADALTAAFPNNAYAAAAGVAATTAYNANTGNAAAKLAAAKTAVTTYTNTNTPPALAPDAEGAAVVADTIAASAKRLGQAGATFERAGHTAPLQTNAEGLTAEQFFKIKAVSDYLASGKQGNADATTAQKAAYVLSTTPAGAVVTNAAAGTTAATAAQIEAALGLVEPDFTPATGAALTADQAAGVAELIAFFDDPALFGSSTVIPGSAVGGFSIPSTSKAPNTFQAEGNADLRTYRTKVLSDLEAALKTTSVNPTFVRSAGGNVDTVSVAGRNAFNIIGMSDADIDKMQQLVQAAIDRMIEAESVLGSLLRRVEGQQNFITTMRDAVTRGIGQLVDADMNRESARVKALQVQQQLGVQALAIANGNLQNLLQLFR